MHFAISFTSALQTVDPDTICSQTSLGLAQENASLTNKRSRKRKGNFIFLLDVLLRNTCIEISK